MIAGIIRFACILLFFLALLNAPYYSAAEIAATKAYNNRWYGGGMKEFSGDFFPSLQQVQAGVFVNSISGPARIRRGARRACDSASWIIATRSRPRSSRA